MPTGACDVRWIQRLLPGLGATTPASDAYKNHTRACGHGAAPLHTGWVTSSVNRPTGRPRP